jgi:hypothetical protein
MPGLATHSMYSPHCFCTQDNWCLRLYPFHHSAFTQKKTAAPLWGLPGISHMKGPPLPRPRLCLRTPHQAYIV